MRFALKKESSARAKPGLRRGRCRILHLSNFTFVCYLEFGKFSNNLHYVDYERLPIEEFSENGGSIPHNWDHEENWRPSPQSSDQLGGDQASASSVRR